MLRGITQIILYSIVVNVEDHLPNLVIWKSTDETVLVVLQLQRYNVLLFQLLLLPTTATAPEFAGDSQITWWCCEAIHCGYEGSE